ncbi:response regulator transcription factor [Treponema sp.]
MEDSIRLMLVDDQVLFAESLKTVIELKAPDIHVVGIASSGEEAIQMAEREKPQIILMDVRMPGMDGVEATKHIHDLYPDIIIMMLTTFDDDEYIYEAFNYGATGYMLKDIPINELMTSLRAVKEGSILISPRVATKLVKNAPFLHTANQENEAKPAWLDALGKREKEILSYIAKGYDNPHIARELFITEQTVKNYVSGIYLKLEEHNRMKVMQLALASARFLSVD